MDDYVQVVDSFLHYGVSQWLREIESMSFRNEDTQVVAAATQQVLFAYRDFRKTFLSAVSAYFILRANMTISVDEYWLHMRPTIACSHTPRMGYEDDGTKFICNPESLLALQPRSGPLRLVGIGSADIFVWEEECLKMFGESNIETMTVFDCTVSGTAKLPPKMELVKECVSDTASPPGSNSTQHTVPFFPTFVDRFNGYIDLLKIDAEGYEFHMVGQWLAKHVQALQSGVAGRTLSVQQLQVEVHRRLAGVPAGSDDKAGLLSTLTFFLHLYGLGFVPVYYEANPLQSCCYEYVFVNATWFVSSEVWMARKYLP
jgi:hypothetical protein